MTEYEFTCSECGQEIEVNNNMRKAIVANGCPVCTAAASEDEFATLTE
jgi:putative FmdB family regulatory protein